MASQTDVSIATDATDRIADSADALDTVLKTLANLATSLQMFQAVKADTGPFAAVKAQKSIIRNQTLQEINEGPLGVPTLAGPDDDEDQCANCYRWLPNDELQEHLSTCLQRSGNSFAVQLEPSEVRTSPSSIEISRSSQSSSQLPNPTPVSGRQPGGMLAEGKEMTPDPKPIPMSMPHSNATPIPATTTASGSISPPKVGSTTRDLFRDFDDTNSHDSLRDLIYSRKAANFIVRPALDRQATIAINIPEEPNTWSEIVSDLRSHSKTVWINIWSPARQPVALAQIASKYGFSPELYYILQSFPFSSEAKGSSKNGKSKRGSKKPLHVDMSKYAIQRAARQFSSDDVLTHDDIETMFYHKLIVDHKCTCIGYYVLHPRRVAEEGTSPASRQCPWIGTWCWLLMCDNLILSLREYPVLSLHEDAMLSLREPPLITDCIIAGLGRYPNRHIKRSKISYDRFILDLDG